MNREATELNVDAFQLLGVLDPMVCREFCDWKFEFELVDSFMKLN